jgi:hypothetical protein
MGVDFGFAHIGHSNTYDSCSRRISHANTGQYRFFIPRLSSLESGRTLLEKGGGGTGVKEGETGGGLLGREWWWMGCDGVVKMSLGSCGSIFFPVRATAAAGRAWVQSGKESGLLRGIQVFRISSPSGRARGRAVWALMNPVIQAPTVSIGRIMHILLGKNVIIDWPPFSSRYMIFLHIANQYCPEKSSEGFNSLAID